LAKKIEPDKVRLPKDGTGKIDPLMVMYNEGQRVVMAHIDAMINKTITEKQKESKNE
jgi:hypothetical protein